MLVQIVEQIAFAIAWSNLYRKFFPNSGLSNFQSRVLHQIVTAVLAVICIRRGLGSPTPVIIICFSSFVNAMKSKRHSSIVVVETVFSYIMTKFIWLLSIVMTSIIVVAIDTAGHSTLEAALICTFFSAFCTLLYFRIPSGVGSVITGKYSLVVVSVAGVVFILSYMIILVPYIEQRREFHTFALLVILALVIIVVTWTLSDVQRAKEVREQKAHIDDLVRSAHKYKEIIPAVERELKEMQMKINAASDYDWAPELGIALDEITTLRRDSDHISAKELIKAPNFSTTGLALLDSQILAEQEEAARNNISFDCVVTSPVSDLIGKCGLTQFQIQQMIGDLYRNAFRAVQKSGSDGRILLILGDTEDGYQIKMCDTGVPFPEEVLAHLGERGLTTGGTGHGLADICEVLAACKASLEISHNAGGGGFTKAVSILFDGKAEKRI